MKRTQIREHAFQLLYSCEVQKDFSEDQVELYLEQNEIQAREEIKEVFQGIQDHKEEIKQSIQKYLTDKWTMDRISKIDFAILELAIYELIYTDIPFKVTINEAVELAKKYGDEHAKSFVNGILASIVKEKKIDL